VPAEERIAATRCVPAPADRIFRLVADPHGQVKIDGSGMLVAAPDAQPLTAIGDVFEMDMDREALGDVPLGKYRVVNTVTKIVPNRQVEWNIAWPGSEAFGHVYGYLLERIGENETEVTNYCDWSGLTEAWRGHIEFPVVPLSMLEKSLENLARVLAEP
jgi:hypothetical protein